MSGSVGDRGSRKHLLVLKTISSSSERAYLPSAEEMARNEALAKRWIAGKTKAISLSELAALQRDKFSEFSAAFESEAPTLGPVTR